MDEMIQGLLVITILILGVLTIIFLYATYPVSYEAEISCRLDDMKIEGENKFDDFVVRGEAECEIDLRGVMPQSYIFRMLNELR